MLNVFVIDVITFFNVGKQMNPAQVADTCRLLADTYFFLKPDDFKLCFNNAKLGYYTQLFDRIDGQILCSWLNEYCHERASFFEQKSIDAAKLQKLDEKNLGGEKPLEVKQKIEEIKNSLNADVKKEDEYKKYRQDYLEKEKLNSDSRK